MGLGSNLGDKQKNIEKAITFFKEESAIQIKKISRWYITKAVSLPGETHPDFLNSVVELTTDLTPIALLKLAQAIETKMGREKSIKRWQARPIDLDILFYGNQILETPTLQIPHPLLHQRLFVLEPLHEIAPDFLHPIFKKTVAQLYRDVIKVCR